MLRPRLRPAFRCGLLGGQRRHRGHGTCTPQVFNRDCSGTASRATPQGTAVQPAVRKGSDWRRTASGLCCQLGSDIPQRAHAWTHINTAAVKPCRPRTHSGSVSSQLRAWAAPPTGSVAKAKAARAVEGMRAAHRCRRSGRGSRRRGSRSTAVVSTAEQRKLGDRREKQSSTIRADEASSEYCNLPLALTLFVSLFHTGRRGAVNDFLHDGPMHREYAADVLVKVRTVVVVTPIVRLVRILFSSHSNATALVETYRCATWYPELVCKDIKININGVKPCPEQNIDVFETKRSGNKRASLSLRTPIFLASRKWRRGRGGRPGHQERQGPGRQHSVS